MRASRVAVHDFRFFAFLVRAFAAAFEALVAIALRSLGVRALARALPPSLASSDLTCLIKSSSIRQILHPASKMDDLFFDCT